MKNIFLKLYAFVNSWVGTIVIVLGVIFFVAQAFVIPSGSMLNTLLIGDNLFVKKFSYGIPTPTIPWLEMQVLPDFNKNGHLIEGYRPKRGDIVIFRDPNAPKIHFVKRNVAIGGDEILYTKEGLWVYFSSDSNYKDTNAKSLSFGGKTFYYDPYAKRHAGVQYIDETLSAFEQLRILSHNGEKIAMESVRLANGALGFHAVVREDEYFMMGDNRNNSSDSRFWGAVPYRYIVGKPWFIYFSWDDAFNIRWERIGKSVESLEKQALEARLES
ncbi:signal peptidase I [Helicobacter turcicus]|uniref:Signal peptidase I n=1 Tax=Helicobacter turcicus TaxID=2867412 RepID=A0ABS7JPF3_9HELI|nr:signal peptidase I [Helicobacter turcicus]MBX7491298.1 signal peptidase I [Helicobacter turcicus]MBX7546215.1 signal peptidase I [Helicobacter turcicus]